MTSAQAKDRRIELLEEALATIERQADGHKYATAYNDGQNIALVNIRNIAAIALADNDSVAVGTTDEPLGRGKI